MPTEVQTIERANANSIPIEEKMFLNRMDIKELLESEWSPEIQEVIVAVKSKISEIEDYFGWYYISFNVCSKKIVLQMVSIAATNGKNLLEDESKSKDHRFKRLFKQKESLDVLLDDLEDLEEEQHVGDGAKSRKRRNLILDDEELTDEETKKLQEVEGLVLILTKKRSTKDYGFHKEHLDGEAIDEKSVSNPSLHISFDSQAYEEVQQTVKQDISDECKVLLSLNIAEDVNVEPVDFENNRVLRLPPKPEDEEDEKKALMYDDDDNRDAAGEWGLWSSSSFESGEYRSRDRPNEEQEKVVKNVVDGHFRALVS
ncbi:hypothetical protein HAX54_034676 [Datura stramonium]|uniref:Uncharacterized protein n=1 Tax=Datura stramonium TaxID=4076 RepID=A0ABS8VF54_DATST|nr:hypothetical protein [Datura stramonium]